MSTIFISKHLTRSDQQSQTQTRSVHHHRRQTENPHNWETGIVKTEKKTSRSIDQSIVQLIVSALTSRAAAASVLCRRHAGSVQPGDFCVVTHVLAALRAQHTTTVVRQTRLETWKHSSGHVTSCYASCVLGWTAEFQLFTLSWCTSANKHQ